MQRAGGLAPTGERQRIKYSPATMRPAQQGDLFAVNPRVICRDLQAGMDVGCTFLPKQAQRQTDLAHPAEPTDATCFIGIDDYGAIPGCHDRIRVIVLDLSATPTAMQHYDSGHSLT